MLESKWNVWTWWYEYLIEHGDYDTYNFSIYPPALNLKWGQMDKCAFNDGDYRRFWDKNETEREILDGLAKNHLQYLFDKTFLVHYRYKERDDTINTAIPKMKIFTKEVQSLSVKQVGT